MRFIFGIVLSVAISNCIAQESNFFAKNDFDSLQFYYKPLYISDSIQIAKLDKYSYINLYYFNGNCSFCIIKMKEMDNFFKTVAHPRIISLFIVETSDTISFNFHRDRYNIDNPVMWDYSNRVKSKLLDFDNDIFLLINREGQIIFSGDILNDMKLMKQYLNYFKT